MCFIITYNRRPKMNTEFNVIAVLDSKVENVLMRKRRKNPYRGLYNYLKDIGSCIII